MRRQLLKGLLLMAVQLAVHIGAAHAGRNIHSDQDMVPGWLGSDYQPDLAPDTMAGRTKRMKVLDEGARIFHYEGLLTPAECDYVIKLAEPRLQPSNVVVAAKSDATNTTKTELSKIRTSHGMFFARSENDAIKAIEERISKWALLPVSHGEGLQVLRYENTEKYEPHWDYFFHKDGINNGGNRYATVLTYLSDVEEGGETVFPFIAAPGGENQGFSDCARKYLAVKPKKGDAVLFHSITPHGALEKRAMHGSCPVIKGTKWSMARWMHVGPYATGNQARQAIAQSTDTYRPPKPSCEDKNPACDGWSMRGECYKNDKWMVGTSEHPGQCLASCLRCDVWTAHLAQQNTQGLKLPGGDYGQGQAAADAAAEQRK